MKRQTLILVALGFALAVAVFWMLFWQPQRETLATIETEILAQQDQQTQLQEELVRLRDARERSPAIATELAAAESVLPAVPAIPSALRQFQDAADASNLTLLAVAPSRPAQVEGAAPGVASMTVSLQLEGSYFQVVDFLRRSEDASISPRAVLWNNIALTKGEYPTLTVALTGELFAQLPAPPPPVADAPETDGAAPGEEAPADGAAADTDGAAPPEGVPAEDAAAETDGGAPTDVPAEDVANETETPEVAP